MNLYKKLKLIVRAAGEAIAATASNDPEQYMEPDDVIESQPLPQKLIDDVLGN